MTAGEEKLVERVQVAGTARFTGRYAGKLDAKGRIVIPTEFRQRLGASEVYCFPAMTEDALQCGPASMVDDLLAMVAGLDVYDEERWALEEEVTAGVMRLGIDETGRTILPKELREHAKIDGPAGFAGRGRHFLLARADYLDDRRKEAKAAALRHRDTLRARMLPSVAAGRRP